MLTLENAFLFWFNNLVVLRQMIWKTKMVMYRVVHSRLHRQRGRQDYIKRSYFSPTYLIRGRPIVVRRVLLKAVPKIGYR